MDLYLQNVTIALDVYILQKYFLYYIDSLLNS